MIPLFPVSDLLMANPCMLLSKNQSLKNNPHPLQTLALTTIPLTITTLPTISKILSVTWEDLVGLEDLVEWEEWVALVEWEASEVWAVWVVWEAWTPL